MIEKQTKILNNGVKIPLIGFGTWQIKNSIACTCVIDAIKTGYIHIDTALAYKNHHGVGQGIKASQIKREDLFITSKIPAETKNYQQAKEEIELILKELELDYIDLVLIHAPRPWRDISKGLLTDYDKENIEVYTAMQEAYKEGKLRAIGVSNFSIHDIENIMTHCEIKPMVNQIEIHIKKYPKEVIEYCQKNNILVEAYSPLATGDILKDQVLIDLAKKYNVTVPQLAIKFTLQLDTVSLPKTTHIEYMKENIDLDDFTITDEDMNFLKNYK